MSIEVLLSMCVDYIIRKKSSTLGPVDVQLVVFEGPWNEKEINNIVAEVDGVIYGVGASVDNLIWICYVHPKWIGKGIGEMILSRLEKDMAKKNFKEVTLSSSLNAYKKIKKKTLTFRDGTKVPCYEMKKRLKPIKSL